MNEKDTQKPSPRPGRGFAGMDREKQKAISSKGGNAGRKGGQAVSQDRAHMAAIGREGGKSRGSARRQEKAQKTQAAKTSDAEESRESGEQGTADAGPESETKASMYEGAGVTPASRASGQNLAR
jgi:general stress protein YciG